ARGRRHHAEICIQRPHQAEGLGSDGSSRVARADRFARGVAAIHQARAEAGRGNDARYSAGNRRRAAEARLIAVLAGASAVDCRDLTVTFITERRTVTALERVSFTLENGGFLSLLGPSGCGKSTLLRVGGDPVPATSGTITVPGGRPEQARRSRALGFVFQDAALLPWRTALQNVELPLEVGGGTAGLPKGAATPRELLQLVGLDGWEASLPHE